MNEKKRDDRYIQFPLCLVQETYHTPGKGLGIILDFGTVNFAKKIDYNMTEVARQLMYAYYRNRALIQDDLFDTVYKYAIKGLLTTDEDYNGFSNNSFEPLETSKELPGLLESDEEFKLAAILRYQINQAENLLRIKDYNIDRTLKGYNEGKSIQNKFESKYGPDCWPSIKPSQLFEFRDSGKDLDLFRAFIGIKSLIGQKKYIATTRNVILMRMLGCKSGQSVQDFIKMNEEAREVYQKYSRSDKALRYNFEKLFESLLSKGFIKSKIFERSVSRKIFISCKLSFDELANEIIEFSKVRDFKKRENEAIKRIRATI
jgi:hypothetical protein